MRAYYLLVKSAGFILFYMVPLYLQAQQADEVAVKNVCYKHIHSLLNREKEKLFSIFAKDDNMSFIHAGRNGHSVITGWSKIEERYETVFHQSPDPNPMEIFQSNFLIRVDGSAAWAQYDQRLKGIHDGEYADRYSREIRYLVKQEGEWKISSVVVIPIIGYGNSGEDIEHTLDVAGHHLLSANKEKEALTLFDWNLLNNPESTNVHYSLGAYHEKMGNSDLALKHYQKALHISPNSKRVKNAISRLREK